MLFKGCLEGRIIVTNIDELSNAANLTTLLDKLCEQCRAYISIRVP
jgi:hypothetical protein